MIPQVISDYGTLDISALYQNPRLRQKFQAWYKQWYALYLKQYPQAKAQLTHINAVHTKLEQQIGAFRYQLTEHCDAFAHIKHVDPVKEKAKMHGLFEKAVAEADLRTLETALLKTFRAAFNAQPVLREAKSLLANFRGRPAALSIVEMQKVAMAVTAAAQLNNDATIAKRAVHWLMGIDFTEVTMSFETAEQCSRAAVSKDALDSTGFLMGHKGRLLRSLLGMWREKVVTGIAIGGVAIFLVCLGLSWPIAMTLMTACFILQLFVALVKQYFYEKAPVLEQAEIYVPACSTKVPASSLFDKTGDHSSHHP